MEPNQEKTTAMSTIPEMPEMSEMPIMTRGPMLIETPTEETTSELLTKELLSKLKELRFPNVNLKSLKHELMLKLISLEKQEDSGFPIIKLKSRLLALKSDSLISGKKLDLISALLSYLNIGCKKTENEELKSLISELVKKLREIDPLSSRDVYIFISDKVPCEADKSAYEDESLDEIDKAVESFTRVNLDIESIISELEKIYVPPSSEEKAYKLIEKLELLELFLVRVKLLSKEYLISRRKYLDGKLSCSHVVNAIQLTENLITFIVRPYKTSFFTSKFFDFNLLKSKLIPKLKELLEEPYFSGIEKNNRDCYKYLTENVIFLVFGLKENNGNLYFDDSTYDNKLTKEEKSLEDLAFKLSSLKAYLVRSRAANELKLIIETILLIEVVGSLVLKEAVEKSFYSGTQEHQYMEVELDKIKLELREKIRLLIITSKLSNDYPPGGDDISFELKDSLHLRDVYRRQDVYHRQDVEKIERNITPDTRLSRDELVILINSPLVEELIHDKRTHSFITEKLNNVIKRLAYVISYREKHPKQSRRY